ncbi:MAG: KTSC domain-containing protein [Myxococcota bacterium]
MVGVRPVTRTRLRSSLVHSVAYDADTHVLEIELSGRRLYRFFAVPRDVYEGLLRAESKVTFFNREIRPKFPFEGPKDRPHRLLTAADGAGHDTEHAAS